MRPPIAYLTILKNTIYSLEQIQYQIEVLSENFVGDVWVVGVTDKISDMEVPVGRFTVRVVKRRDGESKVALFRRLYAMIVARAQEVEASHAGPKAVITYDPFRDGLLAVLLRRRVGWPAILEVNGAYGRPENFQDMKGFFNRSVKPLLFKAVGGANILMADGVRLLYHNQLSGLSPMPRRAVVRHFFDNVPLERFPPLPEEPFLLHVGYPFYRKGIDILLAAFAQVRDEFPAWKLVLIGHELIDHVSPVPPRVEIKPGMSNQEVAGWISRCGCYVLASRSEAMGRVLIEAAAAGKARIASRVDGTYTVLEDEVDGLMFNSEDAGDLARQLRRVMGSPELRRELGAAARTRALADFSADSYSRHVTELVRSVIAAKATRA
jgi:glycosyltransferase involved in cell wall biosynthesis